MQHYLNKIRQKLLILAGIIALGLSACGVEEPTLEQISDPEVIGQTDSTVNLKLVATINNPNNFEIPVKSVAYEIEVLGKRVGYGVDTLINPLLGEASTDVALRPVVLIPEIATMYKDIIGKNEIDVNITGNYHLKLVNQPFSIPIEKSTSLNIQEYLQQYTENTLQSDAFHIKKVYLPEINQQKRTIIIKTDVAITNQLPIKYTLTDLTINAYPLKGNKAIGTWTLAEEIDVEAGQTEVFTAQYYMNQQSILNMLSNVRENTFRLDGNAKVMVSGGTFTFPVQEQITVPWEEVSKAISKSAQEISKTLEDNNISGKLVDSLMNFIKKQKTIDLKDIDLKDILKYIPKQEQEEEKEKGK